MERLRDLDSRTPQAPILQAVKAGSTVLADNGRLALLDALPIAVLLIDKLANVRFVNQYAAEMLGIDRSELFGRNVLDFVLVDDLDFAAELLHEGAGYADTTMGPSRVRYVDATGGSHLTQVWASTTPRELGIEGFILTLTRESVRDVLATAVSSVAGDDELDRTLAAVALSARAMPLCGQGVVLVVQPTAERDLVRFRVIGNWPLDEAAIDACGTPWRRALVAEADADVDDVAMDRDLDPVARNLFLIAGIRALFVRVIRNSEGVVIGVFVVFRERTGLASMNQVDHLTDAVHLAALAFAQTTRRIDLETAVHSDALTGVANRAAFIERLDSERRIVDVLFVDLDHFKSVNDTFGHQIGDVVIAAAADRISSTVRRDDVVYRIGGDEFVVVCEAMADKAERSAMAARLVDGLMAPFEAGNHRVHIGATVGIACGRDRSLSATVRAADSALYEAKARGRAGWAHALPVA